MTLQGLPAATELAGISRVTTLPAPMTLFSPMVTPGQMTLLAPIQQLSPMVTWAQYIYPRRSGLMGWPTVAMVTAGPNITRLPMVIRPSSIKLQLTLM